jgi:Kinetochore CENP-C fungal homologue, Mif2, N-terminal
MGRKTGLTQTKRVAVDEDGMENVTAFFGSEAEEEEVERYG